VIKHLAFASLLSATASLALAGTDERYMIDPPEFRTSAEAAPAAPVVDEVYEQLNTRAASTSAFPKAVCNAKVALEDLRSRVKNEAQPTWDGNLPWRGILGHFQNVYRDAHVEITARESARSDKGVIQVKVRSICTGNLIAYGLKIISDSDFKKPTLELDLKALDLVSINTDTNVAHHYSVEITVEKQPEESKKNSSSADKAAAEPTKAKQANWIVLKISETVETRDGKKIVPRDSVKALKLL
jgi:hypothetical protein